MKKVIRATVVIRVVVVASSEFRPPHFSRIMRLEWGCQGQ